MEKEYLGFEYQPNYGGSCGVYSFGHALNLVGIPNLIDDSKHNVKFVSLFDSIKINLRLKNLKKGFNLINDWGTLDGGIISGIKKSDCKPIQINTKNSEKAKKFINDNLIKGNPIIMSVNWDYDVNDGGHWAVCGGKSKNNYIVIDSAPVDANTDIISLYTWAELEDRFVWFKDAYDNDGYYEFNLIAVESKSTPSCVKQMGSIIEDLLDDGDLQEWWGYYLNDLLAVCDYDFKAKSKSILLGNFIAQHEKTIVEIINYWFGDIDIEDLEYELNNYLIVAKAYQLTISENKKEAAILSFASALIGTLTY